MVYVHAYALHAAPHTHLMLKVQVWLCILWAHWGVYVSAYLCARCVLMQHQSCFIPCVWSTNRDSDVFRHEMSADKWSVCGSLYTLHIWVDCVVSIHCTVVLACVGQPEDSACMCGCTDLCWPCTSCASFSMFMCTLVHSCVTLVQCVCLWSMRVYQWFTCSVCGLYLKEQCICGRLTVHSFCASPYCIS